MDGHRVDEPEGGAGWEPRHLPRSLTSFVGRAAEVSEVAGLLREQRLVTLTGPGGCGKTRLAIEVASLAAGGAAGWFGDGAVWVDLSAVPEPAGVVVAVAAALGVPEGPARSPADGLERLLGHRDVLLVVDNAEHVASAVGGLVDGLLRGCPRLAVLVTSRCPLEVDGETCWCVPPLSEVEAVALFAARARAHRREVGIRAPRVAAVARLCARLDGLPLAIELAAARIRLMSVEEIALGLSDRFRLLGGGGRLRPARHQTLRASMDWSHDLLAERERVLLRRLSVFTGGATLTAVEQVCADGDAAADAGGLARADVLELLTSLVDRSLVQVDMSGPSTRYRLLETVREYAAEKLAAAGERRRVADRHTLTFVELAERFEADLVPDPREALPRVDVEVGNLRAALRHACATHNDVARDAGKDTRKDEVCDAALRLATSIRYYWSLRGRPAEGVEWLRQALACRGGSSEQRGWAHSSVLAIATQSGDLALAVQAGERALPLARQARDPALLQSVLHRLAIATCWQDPFAAREYASEALSLVRGDAPESSRMSLVSILLALGLTYVVQDDHAAARPLLTEAWERAGRKGMVAAAYGPAILAVGAIRTGEFELAHQASRAALDLQGPATEVIAQAFTDIALARVAATRGDWAAGRERLAARVAMIAEQGLSGQVAYVRAHLAELVLGAGDPGRAKRLLDATLTDLAAQPAPSVQAWCLLLRADARLRLGGPHDAADDVAAARRQGAACGNRWQQALADHIAGRIAQARGELNQAAALLRRALVLRVEAGYRPDAAGSLEALASLHVARREDAAAARLLAAAAAVWDEIGWCRRPVDQADYEAGERCVRERLGEETVAATFAEARAAGADASLAAAATAANRTPAYRTPRTAEGWDSLTPIEGDVVRLVAQGLSNPEIGRQLFMARATVKVHLAHVFAKLGITSRAELAAEVGRREHLGTAS